MRANSILTILFRRVRCPSFTASTWITGRVSAVTIHCVTHRVKPIYQAVLPGFFAEHCLLGGLAIGTTLCAALQRMIPAVRRVLITDGGMGRLHAVITMHQPRLGEGKRAVMLAMGQVNLLKLVT